MERRGFLKSSFAGGLTLGGAACATSQTRPSTTPAPLADAELERTMRQLDRALGGIRAAAPAWYVSPSLTSRLTEAEAQRLRLGGELMRSSLRSMLVTSTVMELPEANRDDPRVSSRLHNIVHEADFAALGTLAQLESLTPEDLRSFDDELRKNPDFVGEIVELLDTEAAAYHVSPSRRRHLRSVARHLIWELRRNSSATVLDRTLRQARRVMERHTTLERRMTFQPASSPEDLRWAALTEEALALYQDPAAPEPAGSPQAPLQTPLADPPTPRVDPNCACHPSDAQCIHQQGCHQPYIVSKKGKVLVREDAKRTWRDGGIMLGVGLALTIPGAILIPFTLGISGFAVTAGVILLILGIVFMVRGKRQLRALAAP